MKLIIAIVNYNDSNKVLTELSKHEIGVTKLSTTGGFLRNGNRTFLIGVEDEKVDEVIEIIKSKSHSRKQYIAPTDAASNMMMPIEVIVGGATVFVLDAEQFHKL